MDASSPKLMTCLLLLNLQDILVIGESKLNASFPCTQFQVPGYRLFWNDGSANKSGGGVVNSVTLYTPNGNVKMIDLVQF